MVLVPYQESVSIFQGPDGEQRKKQFNRFNCLDYHLSASTPRPVLPDVCKQLIFAMSSVIYDGGKRKLSFRCCLVLWGCFHLTGKFSAALPISKESQNATGNDWNKRTRWNKTRTVFLRLSSLLHVQSALFLGKYARPGQKTRALQENVFHVRLYSVCFVTEIKGVWGMGRGFFFSLVGALMWRFVLPYSM